MNNPICWICGINKTWKEYKGQDLLNEDSDKPCFECFLEDEAAKEESQES
jgi:hypothetical protein